jgi:hypothetical protein
MSEALCNDALGCKSGIATSQTKCTLKLWITTSVVSARAYQLVDSRCTATLQPQDYVPEAAAALTTLIRLLSEITSVSEDVSLSSRRFRIIAGVPVQQDITLTTALHDTMTPDTFGFVRSLALLEGRHLCTHISVSGMHWTARAPHHRGLCMHCPAVQPGVRWLASYKTRTTCSICKAIQFTALSSHNRRMQGVPLHR